MIYFSTWSIVWMYSGKMTQNVLNFMQFFAKFGKIICWRPRGLAPPPTGNPESAPDLVKIMSDPFRISLSITGDSEFTQITSEGSTYVVAISTDRKLYYRTGKIICRKDFKIHYCHFFQSYEIDCIPWLNYILPWVILDSSSFSIVISFQG